MLFNIAIAHQDDAIGEVGGLRQVMSDHDNRFAQSFEDVMKLEAKKFLGVFWPQEVYKKPIDKKDEFVLDEDGVKIVGILRAREEGVPRECSELWMSRDKTIHKKTDLFSAATVIVFL